MNRKQKKLDFIRAKNKVTALRNKGASFPFKLLTMRFITWSK